jgi:hypothetical protein
MVDMVIIHMVVYLVNSLVECMVIMVINMVIMDYILIKVSYLHRVINKDMVDFLEEEDYYKVKEEDKNLKFHRVMSMVIMDMMDYCKVVLLEVEYRLDS